MQWYDDAARRKLIGHPRRHVRLPGGGRRLERSGEALGQRADALPELVRLVDRERAPEPCEDAGHPVERSDAHAEQCPTLGLHELRDRRRDAIGGLVDREVELDDHLPAPRDVRERAADVGDGVEVLLRRQPPTLGERDLRHAVDPERPPVGAAVVVRRQVPAAGVDDEPVGADVARGLLAGEGAVGEGEAVSAPDRLGDEQRDVAVDGGAGALGRREAERRLERLDAASEQVGKDTVDLRERAVDRALARLEPLPARREQAEDDDDRLVAGQHQRRQPEAGADAVPAADAALALDRDAHVLERRDVPPHRARVDVEVVGDLAPRRQRTRLQELEKLEEPCGRRLHGAKSSTDRGRDSPYLGRSVPGHANRGRPR